MAPAIARAIFGQVRSPDAILEARASWLLRWLLPLTLPSLLPFSSGSAVQPPATLTQEFLAFNTTAGQAGAASGGV
jgi:hypothetical protein